MIFQLTVEYEIKNEANEKLNLYSKHFFFFFTVDFYSMCDKKTMP